MRNCQFCTVAECYKAIISTVLNKICLLFNQCCKLTENSVFHRLLVWVWLSQASHAVEIGHFMPQFGATPFQVKNIATHSNIGLL